MSVGKKIVVKAEKAPTSAKAPLSAAIALVILLISEILLLTERAEIAEPNIRINNVNMYCFIVFDYSGEEIL